MLGDEYENLKPGTEVRFFEEVGVKGPQASTAQIVENQSP